MECFHISVAGLTTVSVNFSIFRDLLGTCWTITIIVQQFISGQKPFKKERGGRKKRGKREANEGEWVRWGVGGKGRKKEEKEGRERKGKGRRDEGGTEPPLWAGG